ncbi:MAG: T9SS type A sorting domain-containing protein [Flavobacteriales bacterium]|nr:T9SS type A sorting domain-containing protein [Flavobacteriales bacterium]
MSGDTLYDGGFYYTLSTARLDTAGNVEFIHNYGDSTQYLVFGFDANVQGLGGNRLLGGNIGAAPVQLLLVELSESAEVISETNLEIPQVEVPLVDIMPTGIIELPGEGIAICLRIFDYEFYHRFIVAKYNSQLQLDWYRIFNNAPVTNGCEDIKLYEDLIIVPEYGAYESAPEFRQFYKALHCVTGEEEWSISIDHECLRTVWDIDVSTEGIVAAALYKNPDGLGANPALYKVSFDGVIEWYVHLEFGYEDNQRFVNVVRCIDESGYVAVGERYTILDPDSTGGDPYTESAVLVKVSEDGELLWQREFVGLESKSDQHNVSDLKATSDGGYIFCGESSDGDSNSPTFTPPAQQGWVVKVDACGCLVPGCDPNCNANPEDPEPPVNADEPFLVGPNPATDFINVHILLEGEDQQRRIELFNYLGQQVRSYRIPQGSTTYMIDTRGLTPGTYIIRVSDGTGVVGTQKVEKVG